MACVPLSISISLPSRLSIERVALDFQYARSVFTVLKQQDILLFELKFKIYNISMNPIHLKDSGSLFLLLIISINVAHLGSSSLGALENIVARQYLLSVFGKSVRA